jgi:D-glucosaminate-6-phosphate ammonia-lyase
MKVQFPETKSLKISNRLSRRNLFKGAGVAALTGLAGCGASSTMDSSKPALRLPITTYESIGLRPVINCVGTVTSLGGSLMSPEVKMAMEEASKHYIPMVELVEAAGRRIAELTGAEWGCVTSGAAGSLIAAAAACTAGADPKKMAQLPDTTGMKNELIVIKPQIGAFQGYIKAVQLKMSEYDTIKELDAAVNANTAIIGIWSELLCEGDVKLEDIISVGKKHGVPVLVDAAAERPDVPNVYLEAGADLVVYSGGKCMRGPQCAGLLFGRKDLVQAASRNIAPFGGIGRPSKVGKEEIMGVLTALDLWNNALDHEAEWRDWETKLKHISDAVSSIQSVKTEVVQPHRPSNHALRLKVTWDQNTVKINPKEVEEQLGKGEPRIMMRPSGDDGMLIMSFMIEDGDEIHIGRRLAEVLSGAV